MIRQVLSIVLSIGVVGCPFVCGKSACCGAAGASESVAHSCCQKACPHQGARFAGQPPAPQGDDTRTKEKCNCICGGAVIEQAASLPADFLPCAWIVLEDAARVASMVERLQVAEYRTPIPNDCRNPGRVWRCLIQSYLC